MSVPILEVKDLKKHYQFAGVCSINKSRQNMLWTVSVLIENGQTVALVGESGCGKSVLLRTIIGLEDPTEGYIYFKGQRYDQMKKNDVKEMRRKIQLIFQDSLSSLHPRFTIKMSMEEPLILYGMRCKKRDEDYCKYLNQVGLDPEFRFRYPEQLSGDSASVLYCKSSYGTS